MHNYRLVIPALAGMLLFAGAAAADDSSEKKRRGPPPMAVEACAAAVEGDPCSFEGRRGNTLEGSCESRDDKPLACRPDGHDKRDRSESLEPLETETEQSALSAESSRRRLAPHAATRPGKAPSRRTLPACCRTN